MSKSFDKLIDQIPILEGGFRRKIIAGVIVFVCIVASGGLAAIVPSFATQFEALSKANLLSPVLSGIILLLLAYAIGGIVEVVSNLYFRRAAGNVLWAVYTPYKKIKNKLGKVVGLATIPIQIFIVVPLLAFGVLWAAFRPSLFEWAPGESCTREEVKSELGFLPSQVKYSLSRPFGELSDLCWEYFSVTGSINHQLFARKLKASMADMIVLISAVTISVLMFLPETLDQFLCLGKEQCSQPQNREGPPPYWDLVLYYLLLVLAVLASTLGLYASLVKQSIVALLEHQALELPESPSESESEA